MSKVNIEVTEGAVMCEMEGTGVDMAIAAAVLMKNISQETEVPFNMVVRIIGKLAMKIANSEGVTIDLAALRKELM